MRVVDDLRHDVDAWKGEVRSHLDGALTRLENHFDDLERAQRQRPATSTQPPPLIIPPLFSPPAPAPAPLPSARRKKKKKKHHHHYHQPQAAPPLPPVAQPAPAAPPTPLEYKPPPTPPPVDEDALVWPVLDRLRMLQMGLVQLEQNHGDGDMGTNLQDTVVALKSDIETWINGQASHLQEEVAHVVERRIDHIVRSHEDQMRMQTARLQSEIDAALQTTGERQKEANTEAKAALVERFKDLETRRVEEAQKAVTSFHQLLVKTVENQLGSFVREGKRTLEQAIDLPLPRVPPPAAIGEEITTAMINIFEKLQFMVKSLREDVKHHMFSLVEAGQIAEAAALSAKENEDAAVEVQRRLLHQQLSSGIAEVVEGVTAKNSMHHDAVKEVFKRLHQQEEEADRAQASMGKLQEQVERQRSTVAAETQQHLDALVQEVNGALTQQLGQLKAMAASVAATEQRRVQITSSQKALLASQKDQLMMLERHVQMFQSKLSVPLHDEPQVREVSQRLGNVASTEEDCVRKIQQLEVLMQQCIMTEEVERAANLRHPPPPQQQAAATWDDDSDDDFVMIPPPAAPAPVAAAPHPPSGAGAASRMAMQRFHNGFGAGGGHRSLQAHRSRLRTLQQELSTLESTHRLISDAGGQQAGAGVSRKAELEETRLRQQLEEVKGKLEEQKSQMEKETQERRAKQDQQVLAHEKRMEVLQRELEEVDQDDGGALAEVTLAAEALQRRRSDAAAAHHIRLGEFYHATQQAEAQARLEYPQPNLRALEAEQRELVEVERLYHELQGMRLRTERLQKGHCEREAHTVQAVKQRVQLQEKMHAEETSRLYQQMRRQKSKQRHKHVKARAELEALARRKAASLEAEHDLLRIQAKREESIRQLTAATASAQLRQQETKHLEELVKQQQQQIHDNMFAQQLTRQQQSNQQPPFITSLLQALPALTGAAQQQQQQPVVSSSYTAAAEAAAAQRRREKERAKRHKEREKRHRARERKREEEASSSRQRRHSSSGAGKVWSSPPHEIYENGRLLMPPSRF